MQNYDFYSGKTVRDIAPQFTRDDPEYFARIAGIDSIEEKRSVKRANRIISIIIALCIISFTAGLVIGIKFAGGSDRKIMDIQTKETVSGISRKVNNIISESTSESHTAAKQSLFLKEEFPYVIKIGKAYSKSDSQEIANFLSSKGHTVILSKNSAGYLVFLGPYRFMKDAELILGNIKGYNGFTDLSKAVIIER